MNPAGDEMSQTEEWDDMSEQTRNEIKARLIAACDTDASAVTLRQHLERASRSGLAARLSRIPSL